MGAIRAARVLIDSPLPQLDRPFDYAVPERLRDEVVVGVRVRMPLRSAGRMAEGYVVEVLDIDEPPRPLSELDEVISGIALVPPGLYRLARRVADRAAGSASDILRLVVPRRHVRVERAWLAAEPPESPTLDRETSDRAGRALDAFPGLADALVAAERVTIDAPPRLVHLRGSPTGVAGGGADIGSGDPGSAAASGTTTAGNADAAEDATPFVGEWATLFAAAAVAMLREGRSAVLVTPDHRDQTQLEAALEAVLPLDVIVRWDARQTGSARYRGYLRALSSAPCVVVGNRSAVYAPVAALGLIALWNDGDPLLEEPLAPYVHARDAALVRADLDGCALLFAGHTRTTDVERLVAVGWVRDIPASRRVSPRVVLTAPGAGESPAARIPSAAFRAARDALAQGPVLVQVARPGFAPVLVCAECRAPARCAVCAGPLHVARAGAVPSCAWCGRNARGWRCTHCQADRFRLASAGSERTADELGRAFPDTRVIIADGTHTVLRVAATPALVIATRGAEPIADGGYRAILLLDGERMLLADTLRIGEACVRWWSDAAALGAPGAPVHLVGVVGPAARALATWNQAGYARAELADRATLRLPPAVRTAVVEGSREQVDDALGTLRHDVPVLGEDDVLGPVAGDPAGEGPAQRALIRFDVGAGQAVASSLRSTIIAQALRTRRPAKGNRPRTRNTLRVRLDDPDPEV